MERRDISQDHPSYRAIKRSARFIQKERGISYTTALGIAKDDYIRQHEEKYVEETERQTELHFLAVEEEKNNG